VLTLRKRENNNIEPQPFDDVEIPEPLNNDEIPQPLNRQVTDIPKPNRLSNEKLI
jgi:hypothetical protein